DRARRRVGRAVRSALQRPDLARAGGDGLARLHARRHPRGDRPAPGRPVAHRPPHRRAAAAGGGQRGARGPPGRPRPALGARAMRVAIYGAGQAGTAVAGLLARRGVTVDGPFGRDGRRAALESGADVVVITTTSFLADIAGDVRAAVSAGSHVLTSAEEAADPWED